MNLGICFVILKQFCAPWLEELETYYPTPEEKLDAVRNAASDAGNEEVVMICDWLEKQKLIETFFPK